MIIVLPVQFKKNYKKEKKKQEIERKRKKKTQAFSVAN